MPGEPRKIPFTAAERSTMRTTAWLMLPVAAIMVITAVQAVLALLPLLQFASFMPLVFAAQWLYALIELAFGICLFVAALALISVARTGTVDALLRGLRALCVVYAVKATLIVLAAASVAFALFGMPLLR